MSDTDLTTLDAVKGRAGVTSNGDDAEIQAAITGFSKFFLSTSGMSSLSKPVDLDEFYDGNGNNRLFVRTSPINSITSLLICGVARTGAVIDNSKKSIVLPYSISPRGGGNFFPRGVRNIELLYNAGNDGLPEDLEYAVRCVVAINYKRKNWQDQQSKGMTAAGASSTTSYRSWKWPPEYQSVFDLYTRNSFIY